MTIHKPTLHELLVPTMKVTSYSYLRNNIDDKRNGCNVPQVDIQYNLGYHFGNSKHAYSYMHPQPCNPFEVVDTVVDTDHVDPEFPKSRNPKDKKSYNLDKKT